MAVKILRDTAGLEVSANSASQRNDLLWFLISVKNTGARRYLSSGLAEIRLCGLGDFCNRCRR